MKMTVTENKINNKGIMAGLALMMADADHETVQKIPDSFVKPFSSVSRFPTESSAKKPAKEISFLPELSIPTMIPFNTFVHKLTIK